MKRWIGLAALGIVAYIGFLVAHLPAAVAYDWVEGRVPARAYGLHGTVWNGEAAAVITGPGRVDNAAWRINPWRVVTGRLGASLEARFPDGGISGDILVGLDNSLHVRDLRLNAPVDTVLTWAGRKAMTSTADGRAELLLRSARIEGRRVLSADGIVNWNDAAIIFGDDIPLGNLALRLKPAQEGGVQGELVTQGGVMDISGDLQLDPDGSFEIQGRIAARDPDNPQADRLISMLRLANPDGVTRVTITGNVDGSGMRVRQRSG